MATKKSKKKKTRPAGRPPKGSTNVSNIIRSVILKNPHMNLAAVKDIAFELLPPDLATVSPSLIHQTNKKLPSFFLLEANRIGLPIKRLIEFLKICQQYPCENVAEKLESRCFNKESSPTALSDIRKSVLSKLAKNINCSNL